MKRDKNKEYKKVMLFDLYAGWSLAFSIMATLALVWGLIYAFGYDQNKSFDLQFGGEWFVLTLGIWIVFTGALFIINTIFGTIEALRAKKLQSKDGLIMYILGMFIPYLGFAYQIDIRRTLIYVGQRLYHGGTYEKN